MVDQSHHLNLMMLMSHLKLLALQETGRQGWSYQWHPVMCLHDLREVKRFSKPSHLLVYRNCSPLSVLGSLSNSGIAPVIM